MFVSVGVSKTDGPTNRLIHAPSILLDFLFCFIVIFLVGAIPHFECRAVGLGIKPHRGLRLGLWRCTRCVAICE